MLSKDSLRVCQLNTSRNLSNKRVFLVSVTFLVIFFVGIVAKIRVIKIHEID